LRFLDAINWVQHGPLLPALVSEPPHSLCVPVGSSLRLHKMEDHSICHLPPCSGEHHFRVHFVCQGSKWYFFISLLFSWFLRKTRSMWAALYYWPLALNSLVFKTFLKGINFCRNISNKNSEHDKHLTSSRCNAERMLL
jgi:hypothetical protein